MRLATVFLAVGLLGGEATPRGQADCMALCSWEKPVRNLDGCTMSCITGRGIPAYCLKEHCYERVVISKDFESVSRPTAYACQDLCQGLEDCVAFIWDPQTKLCTTFSADLLLTLQTESGWAEPGSSDSDPLMGPAWCDRGTDRTIPSTLPATEAGDACHLGHLEAVFMQDLSGSYSGRLDIVKSGVSAAAWQVAEKYGGAKFALASFTDKPVEPFGYPISLDYCYWLYMGLGDEVQFNAELGSTSTRSGNDWYEDPLDAMHQAAVDPRVGWTTTATAPDGRPVSQVMVVSSDGGIHYQGDGIPYGLVEHDGGDVLRCKTVDYPAVSTVAAAIDATGNGSMKVIFIATEDNEPQYETLASQLEAFGIPALVIVPSSPDVAGMQEAAMEALDVCNFPAVPPIRRLKRLYAMEPHQAPPQPATVVDAFDPCAHE